MSSSWMADFSNKMACIEMPKDLFHVQKTVGNSSKYTSSQYTSMLGRFDPFFTVSVENGECFRKIYMRSILGKVSFAWLKKRFFRYFVSVFFSTTVINSFFLKILKFSRANFVSVFWKSMLIFGEFTSELSAPAMCEPFRKFPNLNETGVSFSKL